MAITNRFIEAGEACDSRGTLRFVQGQSQLPFVPRRVFWITDVPEGAVRGGHSHSTCIEALFVLRGSFTLDIVSRTGARESFNIGAGDNGVIIDAGEWCVLRGFSPDVLILVVASEEYRPEGYVNDFDAYMQGLC